MSFDWAQYFWLAFELDVQARSETDPQKQEAKWRSSMSRAYYASWCKARNILRDEQSADEDCLRDHGCVIRKFVESPISDRREIGVALKRMMANRRKADYEDVIASPGAQSNAQILLAQDVIPQLNSLQVMDSQRDD